MTFFFSVIVDLGLNQQIFTLIQRIPEQLIQKIHLIKQSECL
jgi:hypothetical protein